MNIEKIEQAIQLMKSNNVYFMKYKDENIELELDLNRKESPAPISNAATHSNTPQENTHADNSNLTTIDAEILGTFYLQDEEELKQPLIKVGDAVKKGQLVGYIESMKVLNEVVSDFDGTVEEIHISHGEPVEYGQSIITLK
ncbi:acetyl-CoA carboxylase biotin carboxyl carrier protein [Mammaliicoccus sp. Dog046]|uniref:acetyl-CoA carboxylase biotin carboxyl carrier protein n=1 Tax=Mammaliicoccus sp. Dog046 TaxID=3034233 RepID=UPI002B26338D|nr:biotin/lipoyl-containing protein [Mammaliicoccus sp. Dog046]WQK86545.1 biotin/lipoyl-containing protein [Mammaliicoccus sp. Dog046]